MEQRPPSSSSPSPSPLPPGMEEPQTPEDVAAIDPISGLLQMQLLQRIRYLLEVSKPLGSTLPLLASLSAIARSSEAGAQAITRYVRGKNRLEDKWKIQRLLFSIQQPIFPCSNAASIMSRT